MVAKKGDQLNQQSGKNKMIGHFFIVAILVKPFQST
jgi:hypothetical protein